MNKLTGIYWIKNEARYIPEYVEFHLLQGFDHFIFYDNKSDDNLLDVIEPYISDGTVEIRYYPEHVKNRNNFWLMDFCIDEQKDKSEWIHYHALDERLFSPTGKKVSDILDEYKDYGGVCVAWIYFNSGGIINRPDGLIIDNFTTSLEDSSYHIKTIIQPKFATKTIGNPHNFFYKNNVSVDENYNTVTGPFNPGNYSYNKLKLHHYYTLSLDEFNEKMNKGLLDHAGAENIRRKDSEKMWDYLHNNSINFTYNNDLCVYSNRIKENILERYKNKEHLLSLINH